MRVKGEERGREEGNVDLFTNCAFHKSNTSSRAGNQSQVMLPAGSA